ncbi:hypothetical protein PROFUN_05145 [Planoprotostelium fungivorum]|uniref:Uncharacterized protein n=1 Tax=Planoprotostelium fungivorum TaxID=1890364 RepID=A0A2P6NRT7_9EUKA|nr:hypothetical protein PROFUN_05145 [Planoprotostelium fungivorum]
MFFGLFIQNNGSVNSLCGFSFFPATPSEEMQVKSIIFLFALVLAASFGQDTETLTSTVLSTVEVPSTFTTTTSNVITPTGTSAPSTSTTSTTTSDVSTPTETSAPSTSNTAITNAPISTSTTSTTTSDVTTPTETSAPSTSTTPSTFESSSTFTTSSSTTEPSSSTTSTMSTETPTTYPVNETVSTYVPIPTSRNETVSTYVPIPTSVNETTTVTSVNETTTVTSAHGNETTATTSAHGNETLATTSAHGNETTATTSTHGNEPTSSTVEPTNTMSEAPQPTEKPSKEVKLTFSGEINEVDFIKLIAAVVETNVESINITEWKTVTIGGKRDASIIKAVITFFDGKITADDAAHNLVSAYEESKQENGANKFETVAKAQGLPSIQVLSADDGTPATSSTTEPSHTEEEKKEEGDKMSKGKIAGIVIGSLAGVAVLGGLGYYIYKKRQSKNNYYNLHQYA